jgi:hypothetical protein
MAFVGKFKTTEDGRSFEVCSVEADGPALVGLDLIYDDQSHCVDMPAAEALNLADAIRVAAYAAIENRKD